MRGSKLIVSDNSGAKEVRCINVLGSSQQRYARLGNIIRVVVTKVKRQEKKKVLRKKLYPAVLIGTKQIKQRRKGYYVKFDTNRVVMWSDQNKFLGTRVYGPLCKEIRGSKNETKYKQLIIYSRGTV